jgi:hypothetical protein
MTTSVKGRGARKMRWEYEIYTPEKWDAVITNLKL